MPKCEICGNEYDKAFEIHREGQCHVFDCFECAIQGLAPICGHCGVRVIGHGVELAGRVFCCASCANKEGIGGFVDRFDQLIVTG